MNVVQLRNKIHDVKNLLRTYWCGLKSSLDTGEYKISELKRVK